MEIPFSPEQEANLRRAAAQAGKSPADFVSKLVANFLDHEQWFEKQVRKGLRSLDAGESFSDEDVRKRIGGILGR